MAKNRKATAAKLVAYEKVRDMIKERVVAALPSERSSTKTNLFRACMAQEKVGEHWLLLAHTKSKQLTLFRGSPVAIDGCLDGLNIYPRTCALVRFLVELGLITKNEATDFVNESWRKSAEMEKESAVERLQQEANRLGYELTKK